MLGRRSINKHRAVSHNAVVFWSSGGEFGVIPFF